MPTRSDSGDNLLAELEQHNAVLLRLALAQHRPDLSFKQTLESFAEEVAAYLHVERIGIWVFNHDKTILRCLELFNSSQTLHAAGSELQSAEYPVYFASLGQERVVSVSDAASDPRTQEFTAAYLPAHGIASMLDSPIRVGRELRGVLCCEHVGSPREWTTQQERFVASVTDLISSSIATHDMRRTEETMAALLESAAQGVIAVNESGKISVVNSLVEKMFGYKREEILGQPLEKLVPDDLSDLTLEIQDGNLARSSSHRFGTGQFFTGKRQDGTKFPIEIALSFVEQDGDHLALALLTDVTQRVESERKLRESEQLYRTVVEDQTDLISRCTPEGVRTFVNNAYCQFLGETRKELLDSSIYEFIPPRDRKKVRDSFGTLSRLNPVNSYEHRVLRPDGKLALTQWLDHAIFDESGQMREIQSIGRDISKQREAETRLREAQRLESIAVLASGIAHDFNNLLTPILIYAEGLRSYFADGSVESSQVLQIQAAATRAKELVRQILTFGRASHAAERVPTAVGPVVQDTLRLVRASVPAQINFQVSIDTECGTVESDATELYQILSNLCTNACQAMPVGGTLTISVSEVMLQHTDLPRGLYVQLIVKDTGSGVPEENLERIFDPFFSTKPLGEGTGLGLSVVHGIVTGLGGAIEVQSTVSEGTTFVVYLPCSDKPPVVSDQTKLDKRLPMGTERVLVVDDEQSVLESTQFILQQLGYRVTSCGSANEAVTRFSANPFDFDIVISDMTMPRTSGIELLRLVRQQRPEIPVVLMTGFAGLLNKNELKRVGIEHFIIKPVSSQELGSLIRRCLDPLRPARLTVESNEPRRTSPAETILVIDDDEMIREAMLRLLRSLGYSPLAVATTEESLPLLASQSIAAVLVDHLLVGQDGFAEAGKLRQQAAKFDAAARPLIIGMTGSVSSEEVQGYDLDGYLFKPFSADQLREVLEQETPVG